MSYHDVTKELAITKAILSRKRLEVERDRENYRKVAYQKAVRLLDRAIEHIQERWNRASNFMDELKAETPKAVNDRIRKARAKHIKAVEKNRMREMKMEAHLNGK